MCEYININCTQMHDRQGHTQNIERDCPPIPQYVPRDINRISEWRDDG